MKMTKTTRVALRVSLSLILSMIIVELFHLPHGRWVFFVATSTAAGSLGLSIKRSLQRAGMTVLGSLVGAGALFLCQDSPWAEKTLFASIFFLTIYFLAYSYTIFLFFTAILFISIVGLIESYSVHIVLIRIVDVLVGAGCALFASLTILPTRASNLLRGHLMSLVEACKERLSTLASAFVTQQPDPGKIRAQEEEERALCNEAHQALNEQKYERIFGNFFPKNGGLLLTQLDHLVTLLRALAHTVRKSTSELALEQTKGELEAYIQELDGLFDEAIAALKTRRKRELEDRTEAIRREIMLKVVVLIPPDKEHLRQWLNYHTFLHYLYRIDGMLRDFTRRVT